MGEIISLTEEDVKDYLDNAIKSWRKKKEDSNNKEEEVVAKCYIDAFQSVRISLFGELLPI